MELNEILTKFNKVAQAPNIDTTTANHELIEDLLKKIYAMSPDVATEEIEMYEGQLTYNNFLTSSEVLKLSTTLLNHDGARGFRIKDMKAVLDKIPGSESEKAPYYNCNALKAAMNIVAAEIGNIIFEMTGNDTQKYYESIYKIAHQKLVKSKYIRTMI